METNPLQYRACPHSSMYAWRGFVIRLSLRFIYQRALLPLVSRLATLQIQERIHVHQYQSSYWIDVFPTPFGHHLPSSFISISPIPFSVYMMSYLHSPPPYLNTSLTPQPTHLPCRDWRLSKMEGFIQTLRFSTSLFPANFDRAQLAPLRWHGHSLSQTRHRYLVSLLKIQL